MDGFPVADVRFGIGVLVTKSWRLDALEFPEASSVLVPVGAVPYCTDWGTSSEEVQVFLYAKATGYYFQCEMHNQISCRVLHPYYNLVQRLNAPHVQLCVS